MDFLKPNLNKKVLLRERKRHTDRGIRSTPSAALSGLVPTLAGGGGTYLGQGVPYLGVPPILTWLGWYLAWLGGTYLGRGGGTYLGQGGTYIGILPILTWGVPTLGGGYLPWVTLPPPHLDLAGVPAPQVWTDRHL